MLKLAGAKRQAGGVLELDLSTIDILGHQGRLPFKLRKARGEWLSYVADRDRKKKLFLPVGNYYLKLNNKVMKAFTVRADKPSQIKVDAVRR